MKKILMIILLSISSTAYAGGEIKKLCHDVVKKGKTVQECKKIKIHKKVEGKKVPQPSKKK